MLDSKQQQSQTKSVPAEALCFSLGRFQFESASAEGAKSVPVKLLGRSGKPIEHWYWGAVVHDMDGMKLNKDRLPVDYCHFPDEVIGYLDQFDTSSGDLVASGALVPFTDQDRASEVIHKSRNKVPYEASINFAGGGLRLEELQPGASAVVNGNQVNGPALIIRQWTLRGIAVCPYGADMNTKTELSAKGGDRLANIEVTLFKAGSMSKPNEQTKEELSKPDGQTQLSENKPGDAGTKSAAAESTTALSEPAKPGTPPAQQPQSSNHGNEYIAAFGDVGARWFLEGKPFAQCAAEFIAAKNTQITELQAQVKGLKEQLAAAPRGNDPASFAADGGEGAKLPSGVKTGAAAVVASAMSQRKTA